MLDNQPLELLRGRRGLLNAARQEQPQQSAHALAVCGLWQLRTVPPSLCTHQAAAIAMCQGECMFGAWLVCLVCQCACRCGLEDWLTGTAWCTEVMRSRSCITNTADSTPDSFLHCSRDHISWRHAGHCVVLSLQACCVCSDCHSLHHALRPTAIACCYVLAHLPERCPCSCAYLPTGLFSFFIVTVDVGAAHPNGRATVTA